ncbi:MAG: DUF1501 domain-containing protein [Rhodobacteraceae bacterium]|nr:DUF1501 domain-containing protein [Paracoccaceae bacterium]
MRLSRRDILRTATAGPALATIAPGLKVALAATGTTKDTVVVLYLRGGSDGLQMVAPAGDSNYISARPTIRIQTTGNNAGLGIGTKDGTDFYLHYAMPELKEIYESGQLAIVHATGLKTDERSHFECQSHMELGANQDEPAQSTGWLTRHLNAMNSGQATLGTVSIASNTPQSMLGYSPAVAIADVNNFSVAGGDPVASVIRALNQGTSAYEKTAVKTLDAVDLVKDGLAGLSADDTDAEYTNSSLSKTLQSLAALIKMDIGVEIAHVDMGGWDHHDNLINEYNTRATDLSQSLSAFWADIASMQDRVTVMTMTEFGRRFKENGSAGLDHGSGSVMLVLGGNVNGGKIYGDWPGLASNQLFNGDLDVTTDYRRVIAEILAKRQGATNIDQVFPTVAYDPLGIVNGDDSGVISA